MLECSVRSHVVYAITMRKTKNPSKVTELDYARQMTYFSESMQCIFDDVVYETTSGLHLHGIVRVPICYPFTRFRVRGWSIRLEEIYDLAGWLKYIRKDQLLEDDGIDSPIDNDFKMPTKKLF